MTHPKFHPPFLGAAYYPEDWPPQQVDEDIALMIQAGVNVMRMAEFAWSCLEPKEGDYHFDWLHRAVDKLGAAGIASVLGTPTATPPIWLTTKYPEILFGMSNGKRAGHGGRRHCCPNHPVFRDYCGRITRKMGEEFGRDENVVGWQIDNEVDYFWPGKPTPGWPVAMPCSCPECQRGFQQAMQKKYGTIEALNQAWVTNLWSQTYESFEQLPVPRSDIWHHPSLRIAWADFGSDSLVDFVAHQARILRPLVTQPIGTDMMPIGHMDYGDVHKHLDVGQYNNYNGAGSLYKGIFWLDFLRPVKPRPFWVTETAVTVADGAKAEGFCRANTWLPIALGGEAVMYWLWRQHRAGQELMHGGVVTSAGRPRQAFAEVQEIARGFTKARDFINQTRPTPNRIALHQSNRAQQFYEHQVLVHGFNYPWTSLLDRVHAPLARNQWRLDVIEPVQDLKPYKIILSPFLPCLDESGLRQRLRQWIEAGGVWVAGPMTDIRDAHAAKFPRGPFGSLEEWGGVRSHYELPGDSCDFSLRWGKGKPSQGGIWYDGFDLRGARALAEYTDAPFKGLAAAAEKTMGKGKVVVLGTLPNPKDLNALVARLAGELGLAPVAKASPNLLVVPRQGNGKEGLMLVEHENKPAKIQLPRAAVDLCSGKKAAKGLVKIEKYGVRVFQYL